MVLFFKMNGTSCQKWVNFSYVNFSDSQMISEMYINSFFIY